MNPAGPRVFISYARADGEAYAQQLRGELEALEPSLVLWRDREKMLGGADWWRQITDALDQVRHMALLVTPRALESEVIQKEWRYARQRGVSVLPIQVPEQPVDFGAMPGWMSRVHFYDLAREWPSFAAALHETPSIARVPFMAPDLPRGVVPRLTELEAIVGDVQRLRDSTGDRAVVLHGAGGFGKTTLATLACHDDRVQSAYDEGVLWMTLGKRSDLVAPVTAAFAALTGERVSFVDERDAVSSFFERLGDRRCLLVVDDVWSLGQARQLVQHGSECARLLTTRQFDIASDFAAAHAIGDMSPGEGAAVLRGGGGDGGDCGAEYRELASRLGGCALMLSLAGGAIRRRTRRGIEEAHAVSDVEKRLSEGGAAALDAPGETDRTLALSATMDASLEELTDEEQERLHELGVFPDSARIPVAEAVGLWGGDRVRAELLMERLADAALVLLDLSEQVFRLHTIVRQYLVAQLNDPPSVHRRIVESWGDLRAIREDYPWRWISYHLAGAGRRSQLTELLTEFDWLKAKLRATDPACLSDDLAVAVAEEPRLSPLVHAIQLSAHVVAVDPEQLSGQVLGRIDAGRSDLFDPIRSMCGRPIQAARSSPSGGTHLRTWTPWPSSPIRSRWPPATCTGSLSSGM
ncbi:MAG: TIR domain-containing protein [Planctomycetota bacterium]